MTERRLPMGEELRGRRVATFARETVNREDRTAELAFSSELEVERWWGMEILGHDPGEIDDSFIGSGRAPLLMDHNARDLVGVVETVSLGADRKMRARVRFGRSARAEEILADVADGIRSNVSVGYELLELRLIAEEKGKPPVYRCRWRPFEVSLVSVPADPTVGVGRDAPSTEPPTVPATARSKEAPSMEPNTPTDAPPRAPTPEEIARAAVARSTAIMELAQLVNDSAAGFDAIKRGITVEQFRGELVLKRGEEKPLVTPPTNIGMGPAEVRRFSLSRFLVARAEGNRSLAPFEMEASDAAAAAMRAAGLPATRGGAILPYDVMSGATPGLRMADGRVVVGSGEAQRDLGTGSVAAGGAVVQTDVLAASFIDLLRNALMVRAMGATLLSGLVGNVAIPRQTGAASANWRNPGVAAVESDAVFAQVTMTPRTVHAIQDYTRELLLQGSLDVEGLVRADLASVVALAIDLAALHGTGSGGAPTGLAATAGIGSEAGGVNGAVPSWDNIVNLETLVAVQNAAVERVGYLTNSRVRGRLKRQPIVAGQPVFVWGGMPGADRTDAEAGFGTMNGYRAGVTNQVDSTLTKGTSTGVCSAIFFGNWRDLLIGEWGALELLTDNITQAANRVIRVHAYQTSDIAVRRAQSFAAMLDALTT